MTSFILYNSSQDKKCLKMLNGVGKQPNHNRQSSYVYGTLWLS